MRACLHCSSHGNRLPVLTRNRRLQGLRERFKLVCHRLDGLQMVSSSDHHILT